MDNGLYCISGRQIAGVQLGVIKIKHNVALNFHSISIPFNRFIFVLGMLVILTSLAYAAETYKLDPAHTAIVFRVKHLGIAYVFGRFNGPTGPAVGLYPNLEFKSNPPGRLPCGAATPDRSVWSLEMRP